MYYDFSFEIPPYTAKSRPEEQVVKLTHGVIHRVEVGFPPGCAGLAHLQIKRGLHQVWPTNPQGSFNTDGYVIPINEYYEFFTEPYILTLVGWNLDDTFPHTLDVRFGILPEKVLMPEETFMQAFKKLLARLRIT
ncbi:unnamed protein product [marine sediment metagenome]|uniref:Uncharacterized protein n=1 Tax=marine sediment metagenome TaxID=412755 RepID=X1MJU1_9ZZZZ